MTQDPNVPPAGGQPDTTSGDVPVSRERIRECFESAAFWVEALPRYADRNQRRADFWALLAGILAALTGLSIWPAAQPGQGSDMTKILVSSAAFATALCALFPRVMNYGELAGQARELTSRYGGVLGDLEDLAAMTEINQAAAHRVVQEFESTKQKKDALARLPDKDKELLRREEGRRKLIKSRLATIEARQELSSTLAKREPAPQPAPPPAAAPQPQPVPENGEVALVDARQ